MAHSKSLDRKLGLMGLAATGICSMLGASINVVPFMIHRSVPEIGPFVVPAFVFALLPALLAAFAYSSLASAMPRAGGSYIYASRGLHPYLGFIASFSQWFGLSIVIGVIAYIIVPFLRDVFAALGYEALAGALEIGWLRVLLALSMIWGFVYVNFRGASFYERTVIPLMFFMFGMGLVVIVAGFWFNQEEFMAAKEIEKSVVEYDTFFTWKSFFSAAAVLFSSFIGFDAIAQAGGEAASPARNLPKAILLAIGIVGGYYFLFTMAVYHAVPWQYVLQEALTQDISAPGLFNALLPPWMMVLILTGAAVALMNDLPAMLLSVSRLVFAWANDGIFPKTIAQIHDHYHTPHRALVLSGLLASVGVLGSHFAGDFFLGIDIMVISMMVNFLLMCFTLLFIHKTNPSLKNQLTILKSPLLRRWIGGLGVIVLAVFLLAHTYKDITSNVSFWYFHSTYIYLIVIGIASIYYITQTNRMQKKGIDLAKHFADLPDQ